MSRAPRKLTIPAPKNSAPTAAPKVKPAAKKDRLYVTTSGIRLEKLAEWLRLWGFSGKPITEGRERYFDITQPVYWSAYRRRLFKAGLKRQVDK